MTGAMLHSSGIATYGSTFDLFASGQRITFGTAKQGHGGLTSATQQFSIHSPDGFSFGLMANRETGSALGMRGSGAFNIVGSRSHFLTGGWAGEVGSARLSAEALIGRTAIETRDALIMFEGPVISSGFRISAEQSLLGGTALFGITSPLKVERASVRYTLPVAYDLETRSLVEQSTIANLAPAVREVNFEAGWNRPIRHGHLSLGGAYGLNNGNSHGRRSAAGWVRLHRQF